MPDPRGFRFRGFTLVELMIAVALTAIMMGIVSMVFFQAGTVTAMTDAKVMINAEARFILEKMATEIGAAQRRAGLTGHYLRGVQHGSDDGYYDTTSNYRRDGIGFVMTDPEDGPVLVCYWMNIDDTTTTSPRGLVRYTEAVDTTVRGSTTPFSALDSDPTDSDVDTTSGLDWYYMSENVVSLEFRYYWDADEDGLIHEDPPGDSTDNDEDGQEGEDPPSASYASAGPFFWDWTSSWTILPAMVEIRLVVTDPDDRERRLFNRFVRIPAYRDN